jgi:hypothetical protein
MSIVDPGSTGANIVARVKAILLQPKATWDVIDGEPATVAGLYRSYAIPLAAIPVVCHLIGTLLFGYGSMFGVSFRPNPIALIVQCVVQYGLSLASLYVMALIIDGLAPNFGGTKNQIQAFKVAVYASTASWVGGVFMLIPAISLLGVLTGLYSLYLLYLGLPKLMKVAEEKAVAYTALVVVVAVVIYLVIAAVVGSLVGLGAIGASSIASNSGHVSGTIKTPAGSIDLAKLEAASKQMEATQKAAANGDIKLTDPELLKGYLPGAVAGYARTGVSAESGGAGGMGASTAKGTYQKGDATMNLSVVDMGAMGALGGMAGAFNVQSSREENGRYEKVGKVDGRMTTESYDRNSKHGEYSVMVGSRFMVQAEGDNVSIDELKAAVASINPGRLEGLAKS